MGELRPATKGVKVAGTREKDAVTENCRNYGACSGKTEQTTVCGKGISKHKEIRH